MALGSTEVLADDEWEIVPSRTYAYTLDPTLLEVDASPFVTMLNRLGGHLPTSHRELGFDPKLKRGQILFTHDGRLAGRVVRVTNNEDSNDWLSVATVWTVWYDKPWHQGDVTLTNGENAKIEWLEDELFPRVGTLTRDSGPFRAGDLVRVIAATPKQAPTRRKPDWLRLFFG